MSSLLTSAVELLHTWLVWINVHLWPSEMITAAPAADEFSSWWCLVQVSGLWSVKPRSLCSEIRRLSFVVQIFCTSSPFMLL